MSQIIPSLFIDGRKLGEGGIGTFIRLFVDGLLELASLGSHQIQAIHILLSSDFRNTNTADVLRWEQAGFVLYEDNTPKYSIRELILLPLRWRKILAGCDWYISPHYTLPYFIPCRTLLVVHDVIHVKYPENIFHKIFSPLLIRSSLKRADRISTVSEHSTATIRECFPDIGTTPIFVIPNASTLHVPHLKRVFHTEKKIKILAIGADRPHKNLSMFLYFLAELKKIKYSYKATLVTRPSRSTFELIQELALGLDIEIKTNISDGEMESLYMDADCFITTSKIEGFCIPLLDALRSRVPVLCPEASFARCLVGESGWFFNMHSVDDLLRQFVYLCSDDGLRNDKIESGYEKSLKYTPDKQAEALLRALLPS